MITAEPPHVAVSTSVWAPMRTAMFRSLWLALLASNIGAWMQTVGAQWLLLDMPNSTTLVALVQTVSMLPIVLLALPAGAVADSFDKRRMLIAVQIAMVAIGVMLTVLTYFDRMPPALLLTLTFGLGAGQALTMPAWQAIVPDLVPRQQLPSAAALSGISQNLARAVGPAIAGVVIAEVSVAAVFALNALAFAILAVVLWRWRQAESSEVMAPERFGAAVLAGGRYVRHSGVVRRILLRTILFVVPGSALWALLPLVANRQLGMSAGGYGVLLGAIGIGAVFGAILLPQVRQLLSTNAMLAWAAVIYGLALVVVALVRVNIIVVLVLLFVGMGWITVLSILSATLQVFLPVWVRGRGMSIFLVVFAGSLGFGSLLWGGMAQIYTIQGTVLVAAALTLVSTATAALLPLHDVSGINQAPIFMPEPQLIHDPDPRVGPILVTAIYPVTLDNERAFLAAMRKVRRVRRRSGATRWGLFREGERAHRFVEVYLVASWDEHLRQHSGRLTSADRQVQDEAVALTNGPIEVSHLFPAETED